MNNQSMVQFENDIDRTLYADLVSYIKSCTACQFCTNGGLRDVGEGFVPAPLMFVGEAFGVEEKKSGRPFVGDAGTFLRSRMSDHNISSISTENNPTLAFITNTQSCWPPPEANQNTERENGKPTKESIQACKRILWAKIKAVRPKVIIMLGEYAAKTLLSIPWEQRILVGDIVGKVESRKWKFDGITESDVSLVPLYHPSYIIRKGQPQNLLRIYDLVLRKCIKFIKEGHWN
jgi:DNA polymerase